jgi:2-hydroxycyclohexanecarboxyl-CoA dehydrogenase
MRFKDKVVIITGGTSGMGEAATLGFVQEGASVVINDISQERLDQTAEKIKQQGGAILTVQGDITKQDTIDRLMSEAVHAHGQIDILFNYVGGEPHLGPHTSFLEQGVEFWNQMVDLNLISTMLTCQAALKQMIPRKYGKIINTGAIAGKVGAPNMAPYSAVKGGIIALTKALAQEMAPYQININCVCPGPVYTPGMAKIFEDVDETAVADITALKRIGQPQEIASAVLYLASEESSFITGQAIAVDGGATMI